MKARKHESKKAKGLLIIVCSLFFLTMPQFVPRVQALSISPLRQTIVVSPGEEQIVRLSVENEGTTPISVVPAVDAFTLDQETGRPIFGAGDEALSWVKTSSPMTVPAGETRELIFTIAVPVTAEPGAHYLGLFATTRPSGGSVGISTRVGSILFLHVGGEVREELVRQSFGSDRTRYGAIPIPATLILRNVGTIHVVPVGGIIVHSWRGDVIDRQPLNTTQRKILPNTTWQETIPLLAKHRLRDIGPLTVSTHLTYGVSGQEVNDSFTVWYVPMWVIILVPVGFIILLSIPAFVIRQKRRQSLKQAV